MADKNQLKFADQVDLADDDPFAELTRIMGFDPRQPARQATPAATEQASGEEAAEEDDFSLDLEKELLGGFDLEEEHSSPAPSAAAAQAGEEREPEADLDVHEIGAPEVDFDFSAALDEAMATSEIPASSATDAQAPVFDGDLDAAFAAAVEGDSDAATDDGFDLGLTDEDMGGLDEAVPELPVSPEAVARDSEIGADLDAAMADFLAEEPLAETDEAAVEPAVSDEAVAAASETDDFDPGLFDEADFRFEEEPVAEAHPSEVEAEPELQPEIDEAAFHLEDSLRHDEEPAVARAVPRQEPAAEAPSFDEIDFDNAEFTFGDSLPDDAAEPVEELPVATEPSLAGEPDSPSGFELSVPPYMPRKLPTSPMDIAAEEFRQREASATPAEPAFNLEDELNALLGNVRVNQASAEASAASAPVQDEETPEIDAANEPQAFQPFASNMFAGTEPPHEAEPATAPGPIGFEPPEHPADLRDDLNWEFDEASAAHALEQSEVVEGHARDDRFDDPAPAGDIYAEDDQIHQEVLVDLDEVFDELIEPAQSPEADLPYRDAFAAGGLGMATSRLNTGFPQHSFEPTSGQRDAGLPRASAASPSVGSHRDPVVRGNPLKEDPLDVITQLAEKYSKKEPETPYGRAMSIASGASAATYRPEDEVDGDIEISDAFEGQPEVETIDVGDQAIALADDLDIPELPDEEEFPPGSAYDDLDAEFSSLLNDMNAEPPKAVVGRDDPLAGGFSARPYETNVTATSYGGRPVHARYDDDPEPSSYALGGGFPEDGLPVGPEYAADEYEYDLEQEIAPHLAAEGRQKSKSRGLLLAGLIGGVALVGGVGAFALSFGGGEDAPAIVKADEGPVKVRPENPGGAAVPNQDSKVYETVAGEGVPTGAPQQDKLVTTAEEPMDVTPPAVAAEEPATASGKSEDRIEQIVQEAENRTDDEIVAIAPRKVRTMVVKPDGTLVPREDSPEAAPSEQTETIVAATPEAAPAPIIPESTGALPAAPADADNDAASAVPAVEETQATATPLSAPQEAATAPEVESDVAAVMPETVPIAPLRPADQPIDVVGEVKPDQVAAAAATAAAGGGWAMQIASQPSEAAAQSSYQDLARRYGGVLQGRDVNIVKAEIPGKGTFWRVRVPAGSRNEAINLCENYKSAGGNCFVSR